RLPLKALILWRIFTPADVRRENLHGIFGNRWPLIGQRRSPPRPHRYDRQDQSEPKDTPQIHLAFHRDPPEFPRVVDRSFQSIATPGDVNVQKGGGSFYRLWPL